VLTPAVSDFQDPTLVRSEIETDPKKITQSREFRPRAPLFTNYLGNDRYVRDFGDGGQTTDSHV
jgi:hypothetical protein